MKIAIISDHFPVAPRTMNTMENLSELGHNVQILAWNRQSSSNSNENILTFNQKIKYGDRLSKLKNLPKFKSWLIANLDSIQPDVIQAIDFEMLSLVATYCHRNNIKLIYEVFDIKFFNNKFINNYRESKERKLLSKCNHVILASPFFNQYYSIADDKYSIIENKINNMISNDAKWKYLENTSIDRTKKNIGFVGTVRYEEILKRLISAGIKNDNCNIFIIGDGPDKNSLKSFSDELDAKNVFFTGRYSTLELKSIYDNLDVVWACYPSKDENVKYAVSNKFYESQYFNKPIIVASDTYLGDLVIKNQMGFAVNPYDQSEIEMLIDKITNDNYVYIAPEDVGEYTWESQIEKLTSLIEGKL